MHIFQPVLVQLEIDREINYFNNYDTSIDDYEDDMFVLPYNHIYHMDNVILHELTLHVF